MDTESLKYRVRKYLTDTLGSHIGCDSPDWWLRNCEVISLYSSQTYLQKHDLLCWLLMGKYWREREVMTTTRWRSEGKALQSRVTRCLYVSALRKSPKTYTKRRIHQSLLRATVAVCPWALRGTTRIVHTALGRAPIVRLADRPVCLPVVTTIRLISYRRLLWL